jgi:hypothetical protein
MVVEEAYQKHPARAPLPLAGQLLAHAATDAPLGTAWGRPGADPRPFRWVIDGGLGPLLHHASSAGLERLAPTWRQALQAADLTARIRHAERVETTLEILEACDDARVPAVLLKGISVSEQLYPAEHLRPMSDVDVLLPAAARAAVEGALLRRGCTRLDWPEMPGHHHGAPLFHARLHTVVELHTALFPAGSPLAEGTAFHAGRVLERTVASHYHGRPVRRLPPGLQLAYTAASWFNDLTNVGPHPSLLTPAFDAAYLLKACGPALDWDGLLGEVDNAWARTALHLTLSCLPRYGVAAPPAETLSRLAAEQGLVGPIQRRLIHRLLDRQLFGGRPWRHALPPPMPGRYSLGNQLRKRILDRLPGREPQAD